MTEQDTVTCYVVQYRVKSHRSKGWGKWAIHRDYPTLEAAQRECDRWRDLHEKTPMVPSVREERMIPAPDEEWRVIQVTQEVVY